METHHFIDAVLPPQENELRFPKLQPGREEEIRPGKTVLVIGSGGREHAIVDALSRSPRVQKIYAAPGNPGMAKHATCVPIGVTDIRDLVDFAKEKHVDLTVVGPEASLAAGVADAFKEEGLRIFGPTKAGARIESSKEFAKEIMEKYGVPTGFYKSFDRYEDAKAYAESLPLPTVIKYDGLAAGKGVVVAATREEADAALKDMLLDSAFGQGRVLIEEFLDGPEFSFMCAVGGRKVYPLALAQDHKRAYDGDKGPNTGGMGAYSPLPFITEEVREKALKEILQRTADGLADEGIEYTGILYGGLILTKDGPKVIEFNARFGDPETEVVLPRLESDIYDLFDAAIDGADHETKWSDDACLGVVLASDGYPGSYKKGVELDFDGCSKVFHMGTAVKDGKLQTAGGRVAMVTGKGKTLEEAAANAYADVKKAAREGLFYRSDIGKQAL
ncbi:MAG: phosphoribosylamine--glycine ligase [Muribaculaceae bacterium]|nr:phosphoribosylamine--glycine ligase [Muribaculaceae bacterium]